MCLKNSISKKLLSIIFILSCGNGKIEKKNIEVQENNEKVQLRYIFPDGLPALSILSLFSEKKQFDEKTYINYEKITTIETLMGELVKNNENIIAIVPSNLAAQLYNKNFGYQILGTVSWGSLYIVSSEGMSSIEDLKGKKIGIMGRGQTPDIVFRNILSKNNIDPEKLDIQYYNSGTELANALLSGVIKTAVLSEPNVSVVTEKNNNIKIIASLNDEWKKLYSTEYGFPQATLIAKKEIIEKYPDLIKKLTDEMKKQDVWLKTSKDTEKYLETAKMPIPPKVIPLVIQKANIKFLDISDTESEYENYYKILFDFEPKTIGGKVPESSIFNEK